MTKEKSIEYRSFNLNCDNQHFQSRQNHTKSYNYVPLSFFFNTNFSVSCKNDNNCNRVRRFGQKRGKGRYSWICFSLICKPYVFQEILDQMDQKTCQNTQCIKVIGIRPVAPVLNTGPLEGI